MRLLLTQAMGQWVNLDYLLFRQEKHGKFIRNFTRINVKKKYSSIHRLDRCDSLVPSPKTRIGSVNGTTPSIDLEWSSSGEFGRIDPLCSSQVVLDLVASVSYSILEAKTIGEILAARLH